MKLLNEKINALYQSQKKDMGGTGLLWMALIFAILSCFFFVPNVFSKGVIDRFAFGYFGKMDFKKSQKILFCSKSFDGNRTILELPASSEKI